MSTFTVDSGKHSGSGRSEEEELEAKRRKVVEAREAKRQKMLKAMSSRRKARSGAGAERKQLTDAFTKSFAEQCDGIEEGIESAQTYEEFVTLKKKASLLADSLSEASRFLPAFIIESKLALVKRTREKIEIAQEKRAPRPKFSLKRRLKATECEWTKASAMALESLREAGDECSEGTAVLSGAGTGELVIDGLSLATVYKESGAVNGSDVCLSNLKHCTVSIADHCGALRMSHLQHCTIITGPISGSLHVEVISDCTVHAAMRQCRIHHANNCDFYIHANSDPIIEDCTELRFAPYVVRYAALGAHWLVAAIDKDQNHWDTVKDFNWFKKQHSPNWTLIPAGERLSEVAPVKEPEADDEL